MSNLPFEKTYIEHKTQQFLDKINSAGGPPIYELPPEEARKVLEKVQDINITKQPANIEDITIVIENGDRVDVRIVRPEGITSKSPGILYFHGGGWVLGDTNTHDRLVREIANGTKAAVIFFNYERSPESQYPKMIEQGYMLAKYIYNFAEAMNIDSSRLAIAGDSVGGNMAAVIAILAKKYNQVNFRYQVLFYPVTAANFETESYNKFANGYWLTKEAMKWFWDSYLPDKSKRNDYKASPLMASSELLKGLPPTLIITDENDVLRDEGEAYARKLMDAGVDVTAIRMLGTIHDFVMLNELADTPAAKTAIELANMKLYKALNT